MKALIPDTAGQDNPAAAEKYMRGKVKRWRRERLNDADDTLERYLGRNGGVIPLSCREARTFDHVQEREEENTRAIPGKDVHGTNASFLLIANCDHLTMANH